MSFVLSLYNVGITNNLFGIWLNMWFIAFSVAFPVVLLIAPLVGKMVEVVMTGEQY